MGSPAHHFWLRPRTGRSGPPWRLPALVDTTAEWWAAQAPRRRQALLVVALAAVLALLVRPRPHRWGPSTPVVVATSAQQVGDRLTSTDVALVSWPSALAPDGAVADLEAVVGRRASAPLVTGQVVVGAHLGPRSPADRAPSGWTATAVESTRLPALAAGTVLDVHGGNGISVLGALVLDHVDDVVWLAVPRDRAAALAQALAWGEVHVAVWADDVRRAGSNRPGT